MVIKERKVVSLIIGFSAALLAWSFLELTLIFENYFRDYRIFLAVTGALTGASLGAVIASQEGLLHKNRSKIAKEWILGLLWGLFGGILGTFIGQMLFVSLLPEMIHPEEFQASVFWARTLSWALLGAFVGTSEGLRSFSVFKLRSGIISGLLSGLLGGAVIEGARVVNLHSPLFTLLGLIILASGTTLLTLVFDDKSAPGAIKVLNGGTKGRSYTINQSIIRVGSAGSNDIIIHDDKLDGDLYFVRRRGRKVSVEAKKGVSLLVNEKPEKDVILKYGDVIKIGDSKFMYEVIR